MLIVFKNQTKGGFMKFFYSLILILAAPYYAYSAIDPDQSIKAKDIESINFGNPPPSFFPLLIYKQGVAPCVLERGLLENTQPQDQADLFAHSLLKEDYKFQSHQENFKLCSLEAKADFLSAIKTPPKTAMISPPLVVAYYTVCTMGQIGVDRAGIILDGDTDFGTGVLLLAGGVFCFPVVGINQFSRWLIHGDDDGMTPFYPWW